LSSAGLDPPATTRTWVPDWKRMGQSRSRVELSAEAGCLSVSVIVGSVMFVVVGLHLGHKEADDALLVAPPPLTMKTIEATPLLNPAWAVAFAALPPEKQAAEMTAEFRRRNPGFVGDVEVKRDEKGAIAGVHIESDHVSDITPVRAVPGLREFVCRGSAPGVGRATVGRRGEAPLDPPYPGSVDPPSGVARARTGASALGFGST
jgi:hypothetical protein